MPVQYNPARVDWSVLGDIGQSLGEGYQRRRQDERLRNAIGPNGEINFRALWEADPMTALKYKIEQDEAAALASYRGAQTAPSVEDQILLDYLKPQEPFRVGPAPDTAAAADAAEEAEASGTSVPGISTYAPRDLRRAPKVVQEKLAPVGDIEKWKAEDKAEGERNALRAGLKEAGPIIQKIFTQGVSNAQSYDPDTVANALGPLQGADDPANGSWVDALSNKGAQTWGSLLNYMQHTQGQGLGALTKPVDELPGGLTSTVRDNVKQFQAAIINQLQRVQRVVGIGSQSDKELQQIIDQVGKLQNSRTKNDLLERMSSLATLLNDSGIPVQMPSMEMVLSTPPTKAVTEQYRNPPAEQNATMTPNGVNENTMVGGVNIGRTTNQPPTPPQRALNALKTYRNNPEARAAFDEIYGPGAADFYLQKSR